MADEEEKPQQTAKERLQAGYEALTDALLNPEQSTRYADRQVTWRSVDEIQKARELVEGELAGNKSKRRIGVFHKGL